MRKSFPREILPKLYFGEMSGQKEKLLGSKNGWRVNEENKDVSRGKTEALASEASLLRSDWKRRSCVVAVVCSVRFFHGELVGWNPDHLAVLPSGHRQSEGL